MDAANELRPDPLAPLPDAPAQVRAALPTVAVMPATPKRHWRGLAGTAAALVLAFVWGAMSYREFGPQRMVLAPPPARTAVAGTAVAGVAAPPSWITAVANAFCSGDADVIVENSSGTLAANAVGLSTALANREWTCVEAKYLGGGSNATGDFFVYMTRGNGQEEQWWVFTAVDGKLVDIE